MIRASHSKNESMAEAGKGVADYLDDRIIYFNVMNRLSVDCDCDGFPEEPDIHDIGILASTDPVALDQACIDLIWEADEKRHPTGCLLDFPVPL